MSKEQYIALITQWAALHPGGLWQDTPEAAKARKWLRKNAPDTFSAIYYNEPNEYRTKIDRRFLPAGVEAKNFKEDVRKAINDTGTHIYNVLDKTTAWVPGPTGMVNWLGHVVADAAQGNVGNLAMHAGMAGLMGGAGRLAGKYLPKVASKIAANNPKFGTFMQKAGELADDLSWNRQRQDDAMAEWLANRDVRQRFNIGAADPTTTSTGNAIGATEATIGSKFDGVPTKDSISYKLLDRWILDNDPTLLVQMHRNRRADWANAIMDNVDLLEAVSPDVLNAAKTGVYPILPFKYRAKKGTDIDALNRMIKQMEVAAPYKGDVHLPETVSITPFTSLFDEPIKARDTAFEIMQRAAAAKKLSPKPVEHWTAGGKDIPSIDKVVGQQINASELQKPVLWFNDSDIARSGLYLYPSASTRIAAIGMRNALTKNAMIPYTSSSGTFQHLLPVDVVGHETGHIHPGFNTKGSLVNKNSSPYYGHMYNVANPVAVKALQPNPEIIPTLHPHDQELAEWFSDAMGVRTLMEMNGINKGMVRPYNSADITRLNAKLKYRYGEVPKLRFAQMRPKMEDQVAALNYGWAEGGKLLR